LAINFGVPNIGIDRMRTATASGALHAMVARHDSELARR
jgi:hypothetical protein